MNKIPLADVVEEVAADVVVVVEEEEFDGTDVKTGIDASSAAKGSIIGLNSSLNFESPSFSSSSSPLPNPGPPSDNKSNWSSS